ncbi:MULTISPECIES: hypothetical protein [Amniculibacterium]|jgi:hypothetical protein|uniref:hypothetical protein n=1 Tax=Amniculibacterium TaxID=2715289 RepID=UPI000F5AF5CC|nr:MULTISPECIES: hypothetical protein [Amniculibacterium]
MQKFVLVFTLAVCFSYCSENQNDHANYPDAVFVEPKYDTTPVDSFSAGATSADVARRIRMASSSYQDSLKKALQKEAELLKQKQLEEKLKKEVEKSVKKETADVQTSTAE